MADRDDLAKGAAGGVVAALLLGATQKKPKDGSKGDRGEAGPRGPGLVVVAQQSVQWTSPAIQSPISRLVTSTEAPISPPAGATHLIAMLVFQQQNSPQLEILCITNGIFMLPLSPGPLVPQVQWRMENGAPLAGGETTVTANLVWMKEVP